MKLDLFAALQEARAAKRQAAMITDLGTGEQALVVDGEARGALALSPEAMEALQDLSAIAQVQGGLEESEDGESDYMEVMEYLRVAPLLLFTECVKPAAPAAKPSLH